MKNRYLLALALCILPVVSYAVPPAGFLLDNVFTDHMVVQRDKPIRFSGWADPGTKVKAGFNYRDVTAVADDRGRWVVEFPAMKSGGPLELHVSTDRRTYIVLKDILVGDVWVCSGQSNMEMPIWGGNPHYRRLDGDKFSQEFRDDRLRLLQVPKAVSVGGEYNLLSGRPQWKVANTPDAIREFSFTGFSFGMELRKALQDDVPIGLVNASWGGTLIEPWIPFAAYKDNEKDFGEVVSTLEQVHYGFVGDAVYKEKAKQRSKQQQDTLVAWVRKFMDSNPAASKKALSLYARPDLDTTGWERVTRITAKGLVEPGVAWYRYEFDLKPEWVGKDLVFHIDYVNDADETFLDGVKIGETGPHTMLSGYWAAPRNYHFKADKPGRHVIAIRAQDHFSNGGLGTAVFVLNAETNEKIDFTGRAVPEMVEFRADLDKVGDRPPVPSAAGDIRASCQTWTALYNTMIAPLTSMNVKGVIWYQGCSNAGNHRGYPRLQKLQMEYWRRAFHDANMTFIITQLSAFQKHCPDNPLADDFWKDVTPVDIGYAPMRAAQYASVDDDPNAGIACTIDIGMHSDIHPKKKQEVGRRLAKEALRIAYGDASAQPGPHVRSVALVGSSAEVTLAEVGEGIYASGGKIDEKNFALAGADGVFHWADAKLTAEGKILVSCPEVKTPVKVRYAYLAYPHNPNLYRKGDDLPVFPFEAEVGK